MDLQIIENTAATDVWNGKLQISENGKTYMTFTVLSGPKMFLPFDPTNPRWVEDLEF